MLNEHKLVVKFSDGETERLDRVTSVFLTGGELWVHVINNQSGLIDDQLIGELEDIEFFMLKASERL